MTNPEDVENLDLTDPDYPYGKFIDSVDEEDQSGTIINSILQSDWLSVFGRSVEKSGTVRNGLKDNESTGYQLYDAMFGTPWVLITSVVSSDLRYRFESGGKVIRIIGNCNNELVSTVNVIGNILIDTSRLNPCINTAVKNDSQLAFIEVRASSQSSFNILSDLLPGETLSVNLTIALD